MLPPVTLTFAASSVSVPSTQRPMLHALSLAELLSPARIVRPVGTACSSLPQTVRSPLQWTP